MKRTRGFILKREISTNEERVWKILERGRKLKEPLPYRLELGAGVDSEVLGKLIAFWPGGFLIGGGSVLSRRGKDNE